MSHPFNLDRFALDRFILDLPGIRVPASARQAAFLLGFVLVAPSAHAAARVTVQLPPAADLAVEDARRDAEGLPWRFALPEAVRLTPSDSGRWESLPDGARRWRLEVASPGAVSLNLGFTGFWLPRGATLTVRPLAGLAPSFVFDDGDNADHGELWTPIVPGDGLVVELEVPADAATEPLLELGSVNSGYRGFGGAPGAAGGSSDKSGACNLDVACSQGDPWRAEIASVGLITVGGSITCSGAMVNNTAYDGTPYFLTANHCGVTVSAAPSVVVYWNYESPSCGQHGGGMQTEFTTGSTLRSNWSISDFTLLELDELPDPAFGVTYAGWNRGSELPVSAVGIHHPQGDEKSISFEEAPLHLTSYTTYVQPGDGTHLQVIDWDQGTTEPGSSGSPLFDAGHLVVGQLHGGYAACGNDESDWYGWLNRSWDGGDTSATRLSEWLDPIGAGVLTLPLLDPAAGQFAVTPATDANGNGPAGGPFTPSLWEFTLTNEGTAVASFTAMVDQTWLTVEPTGGTVAAGNTAAVNVSLAARAFNLGPGRHAATLTLGNPSRGSNETRAIRLEVYPEAATFLSVGPNPFRDSVTFELTLPAPGDLVWRVFDLRGLVVRGPVSQAGLLGANDIVWDGRDDQGRRLPSGSYVLSVQAPGQEFRSGVVCGR